MAQHWQWFEAELNGTIIRTYDLETERVRVDSTTACAYVTAEGLFQFGHSKDHRPDLPQLKISMSVLDPMGLPLTTTVLAGQSADDPIYIPEIAKARRSIGHSGLTYIGDCKMAALETRAEIVAHSDYYLCPLSALQMPTEELDRLLEPVFADKQPLKDIYPQFVDLTEAVPDLDERIAVGFEYCVKISGLDQSGKTQSWKERRLVIRSLSFAHSQTQSLHQRIARASAEILKLNERKQGKPVLKSQAQVLAAAQQIALTHQVSELLHIEVNCHLQEKTKRAYASSDNTAPRELYCAS